MSKRRVNTPPVRRIGEILQEAYLITPTQLEEALLEQQGGEKKRLGDILAAKGWIKGETVDFFAEKWDEILQDPEISSRYPLGYYLQEAGLLDDSQIRVLVREQGEKRLWVRLGTLAVLKGWLAQSTIDFLVEHLYPERAGDSPFLKPAQKKTWENVSAG